MAVKKTATKAEVAAQSSTLAQVSTLSLQDVVNTLSNAQVAVQKTFADLGAQVTGQFNTLDSLNVAIQLKKEELKSLHGIEATADTADALNREIEENRAAWQEELRQRQAQVQEESASLAIARAREETEYAYNLAQKRKKEEDTFAQQLADRKRQETVRQQDFEREFSLKKAALAAQEDTYNAAIARSQNLDSEVNAKAMQLFKQREAELIKDHNFVLKQLATTRESENQVHAQKLQSAEEKLAALESQNEKLESQVQSLQTTVATLGGKALEAASGAATMQAVQSLATTQAANPSPVKR